MVGQNSVKVNKRKMARRKEAGMTVHFSLMKFDNYLGQTRAVHSFVSFAFDFGPAVVTEHIFTQNLFLCQIKIDKRNCTRCKKKGV